MPWGRKRYQQFRNNHFITFSCYHRLPFLRSTTAKEIFEAALERTRRQYDFWVFGYAVMPEHVHLLVSEPKQGTLADAIKSLKQSVSRQLIRDREHFWQKSYYDFNVCTYPKHIEKLRYIHRNPVKRGLCARPQEWQWSSYRHYLTEEMGTVEIESWWTEMRRKKQLPHSSQLRA